MVAWLEEARDRGGIVAGEKFSLPVLRQGARAELQRGDELYWTSRSVDQGDTDGDPGGIVKVTLQARG